MPGHGYVLRDNSVLTKCYELRGVEVHKFGQNGLGQGINFWIDISQSKNG